MDLSLSKAVYPDPMSVDRQNPRQQSSNLMLQFRQQKDMIRQCADLIIANGKSSLLLTDPDARHPVESAAREFGQVLGNVISTVAKRRASEKLASGVNFDPLKLMGDWPPGMFRCLFTAVCPNEYAVEPATVRKKTMKVLAALEVLANARSQKEHVLQQFLSDV